MGTITKRALAAAMASSESKVSTPSASKVAEGASKVVDSASAVAKDYSDADGLCECGTKYVCNSDFFRVRIMRYPAFVWIYGCSQIPEDSPFAHEDSPFFEGKDDRCHCSCACGKEEAYKYTDSCVVAQLKDATSARQTEAPSAQAMHASTEDLKAEAEAAEVV